MKMTKLLCLLLAVVLFAIPLAACNGDSSDTSSTNSDSEKTELTDEQIYNEALGEFAAAYEAARAETNVSKRYALMAIAEAKLLESGVMMPMQANGGNYAISKVVPYTITPVLWGTDSDRYHNALVCTEPLKPEDRDTLKAMWADLKGTGTYEAEAKKWLEENGYTLQRTYSLSYSSDYQTLDLFLSQLAVDSEILVNTYDGLVEYDGENVLQPALATEWSVSDDGLTWTFKLREGVKWVDSTGAEVADLKADDFLAGFQHMLDDPEGGLSWLVDGIIVGVSEYVDKDIQGSFDDVGVKALDDYTIQYTLVQPVSYFDTMLGYGVFAPLNRAYYTNLGGKFGFANGEWGDYGTDKDHIAYCGPYIITSYIAENTVVFEKNPTYWNVDNINIDKITWIFNDGQIATKAYSDFKDGVIDGCGLNAAALALAQEDGNFEKYAYVSGTDATSFPGFFNLHRRAWANFNDDTAVVSAQTDEIKARTQAAMLNKNFRLALAFGLDRGSYMEQTVGADLKYTSMVNSYVPGTFVALEEEVTVSINGTNKTYPAGTWYGQIMQDQIDADGFAAKVFDPNGDGGLGSSSGYDGWYNVTEAKKYIAAAIEELAAEGIEVSAENPIHLDFPSVDDGSTWTARANVVKRSLEESLGGAVVIDLVPSDSYNPYAYATYYFGSPTEANYNLQLNSGWGPDFGDPSTYLDTMAPGGYMLKCLGLVA